MKNVDKKTIKSFGDEWVNFNQEKLSGSEYFNLFDNYFHIFPWKELPKKSQGFDMGCGSGRWAKLVAPRVSKLNCIDPSSEALEVAKKRLKDFKHVNFINLGVSDHPLPANSQDFGYCLGVLHHIPNTHKAIKDCVKMLKPGAPLLVYLYYKFDNRPNWYVFIWKSSDLIRKIVSILPSKLKLIITNMIATIVYFPFARFALIAEKIGINVHNWPLSSYRNTSFYTMRTDSRDRFGTPLEKRFTKFEIKEMMFESGLENIKFSEINPFWCAVGKKKF